MKVPKFFKKMNNITKICFFAGILIILATLIKHNRDYEKFSNPQTESFFSQSREKSLILFYAPWCGHCKSIMPIWDRFSDENQGKTNVHLSKVDCEDNPNMAKKYNIEGFPTILYLENGDIREVYTGSRTLAAIVEFLKKIEGRQ